MRVAGLVSVARPVFATARLTVSRPRSPVLSPCYKSVPLLNQRFVHSEQPSSHLGPKRPPSYLSRGSKKAPSVPSEDIRPDQKPKSPFFRRFGFWVLVIGSSGTTFYLLKSAGDDHCATSNELSRDLVRAYIVYTLCSSPSLIDVAPNFINWVWNSYIPGVKLLFGTIIRYTFFEQFVGAETLQQSSHVVEKLAKDNIGVLFNYSVEASETSPSDKKSNAAVDLDSPLHDELVQEITSSVEYVAQMNKANGLGTSVAFKFSGLLKDPSVLLRLSTAIVRKEDFTASGHIALFQPDIWNRLSAVLSTSDANSLASLLKALEKVGESARSANVKLIIDAEQSWLQPAIDAIYLQLARKYNRVDEQDLQTGAASKKKAGRVTSWLSGAKGAGAAPYESQPPIFYTTLQCSLRRSPALLEALLEDGRRRGWSVGVKVVRGAYVDQEHAAADLAQILTPAWSSKAETDKCFDACAQMLLDDIAHDLSSGRPGAAGAMFASHNRESVTMLLHLLQERGLAKSLSDKKAPQSIVTPQSTEGSTVSVRAAADQDPILVMSSAAAQRICFGQLYGMADDITIRLSTHLLTPSRATPAVYKYVPYGPLDSVLPYLVRRAKENKAIMTSDAGGGGANAERKRLKAEMWRRCREWWNDLNGGTTTPTSD